MRRSAGRPGSSKLSDRPYAVTVPPTDPIARSSSRRTAASVTSQSAGSARNETAMFASATGASASTRCRPAIETAPAYIGPAAKSEDASRQIIPAATTIGHDARDRRRLTWSMAASDEINGRVSREGRRTAARESGV